MDEEIYPKSRFQEPDRMPGGHSPPPPPPSSPLSPAESVEPDRMPGEASPSQNRLGRLKSNKPLLFALLGLAGGCAGALVAEIAPGIGKGAQVAEICVKTGIWAALAASAIAAALFAANELHRRRPPSSRTLVKGALIGLFGGFIAGALAELLFQKLRGNAAASNWVYAVGWATFGLVLAVTFSRAVPNMGLIRGAVAGLLGGGLGGFGFITLAHGDALPGMLARMTGLGILGLALGLAVVVVERLFREAALEVIWAPNENSFFNLGAEPVRIGGGSDDEIYVRGLGPGFARIIFQQGQIEYVEAETKKRTPLKNESSLQIGALKLVIHAAA